LTKILLVEDQPTAAAYLAQGLREAGMTVDVATNGPDGLHRLLTEQYALAILDVMLPGLDGWTILATARLAASRTPVLFVTARDDVEDRVHGLELGADDYLVKPFAFKELVARIDALARRAPRADDDGTMTVDAVRLDPRARRVTVAGETVDLTAKEFDLLACLMEHRGRVLSRVELKELVWDFSFDAQTKVVDLYIHYLRRKLGTEGEIIETVRGVGYVVGR
jgi:two-component system copper resistance phosphate regulon response regulator CusR